ncbi:MAG: hypothetical protein ACI9VR_002532 [Cognaticolwellia sp.]
MLSLLALLATPLMPSTWTATETATVAANIYTGTYVVAQSPAAIRSSLDKKAAEAAESFPFYAKSIAEGRLIEAMTFCETYQIDLQADSWSNKCDSLPVLNRPIDSSVTSWQGAGGPVKTRISRKGDKVTLVLATESGKRVNTFVFKPDGTMNLTVSLASDSLEEPVVWTVAYKLQ